MNLIEIYQVTDRYLKLTEIPSGEIWYFMGIKLTDTQSYSLKLCLHMQLFLSNFFIKLNVFEKNY